MRETRHGRKATGAALGALAALTLVGTAGAAVASALPTKLAYVVGLQGTSPVVRVADGDGRHPITLGPGVDALISPDGARVAIVTPFSRNGSSLVVRSSGGGAAHTLEPASDELDQLAWSPDGRRIVVVVNAKRLDVVDVATGARRAIARGEILGASFSPDGTRIVYARSRSDQPAWPVNVFVAQATGGGGRAITHDGRSLYPLWGPARIAYTHERLRRADAPIYQLRTMRPDGGGVRQLTHMRIPTLVSGLTATSWSADGARLLAEYGGQDTSEAWTVDVRTGRARDLTGKVDGIIGRGLSADGRTVLVQRGYFDDPRQSIATLPWRGGRARALVGRGADPSWGG